MCDLDLSCGRRRASLTCAQYYNMFEQYKPLIYMGEWGNIPKAGWGAGNYERLPVTLLTRRLQA
jgi:hypothetical protein